MIFPFQGQLVNLAVDTVLFGHDIEGTLTQEIIS
jgi:hypothetical protein